jgi:hypothetical protein
MAGDTGRRADLAARLGAAADLLARWDRFELRGQVPPPLDYVELAALLWEARAALEMTHTNECTPMNDDCGTSLAPGSWSTRPSHLGFAEPAIAADFWSRRNPGHRKMGALSRGMV